MLELSLIVSAILLVIVNFSARRLWLSVASLVVCGLGLLWLSGLASVFLWPVGMQFVLLAVIMLGWPEKARRPWSFLGLSLAATAAAFGIATCISLATDEREYARLRARYPYESIAERLPVCTRTDSEPPLADDTREEMTRLEKAVQHRDGLDTALGRAFLLRRLHEDRVKLFMNSSGFGEARMIGFPSERRIAGALRRDFVVAQPGSLALASGAAGDPAPTPAGRAGAGFRLLHREGIEDFVYPVGFGYVKDRRHVAGFQPHRFSKVPGPEEQWHVARLELVSLLLHERPVVYVSESLPRMDKLRGAQTRPLDGFEAAALEKLRRGEYLLVADAPEDARMLGAIRSLKQCTSCHGGERGDLLGAFSYTVRWGERQRDFHPHSQKAIARG